MPIAPTAGGYCPRGYYLGIDGMCHAPGAAYALPPPAKPEASSLQKALENIGPETRSSFFPFLIIVVILVFVWKS